MTEVIKATELVVQEYVASIGLNPNNVFYQRIASTNVNTSQAQWQIISPNKNALLLSNAWINWKPTITRVRTDTGAAENFIQNGVMASFKSAFPFANAMSNIQTTLNSASISISQPRRFMEHLAMMFAGRQGAKKCLSGAGGGFLGLDGYNTNGAATQGTYAGWLKPDYQLLNNEEFFGSKLIKARGNTSLNGTNSHQINCLEPVIAPPFNPFLKLKDGMPDYCWFKHMSPMIPHVSNLEISINFQNINPSTILSRYIRIGAAGQAGLTISTLAADLILWWYAPPPTMTIPRQVAINSWNVREFVKDIGAVNNNTAQDGLSTELIQLHAVPSLIVIHAEVDKDSDSYTNASMKGDTDQAGGGAINSANANALDSYCEITNFQVILGDRPQVISTTFTQEELYYLTVKNSKVDDFPYEFQQWKGSVLINPVAAAGTINRLGKMFIALRPKDLSEKFGAGVKFPTSLQFSMSVTPRDGLAGLGGGNKSYKLYTHVYSGKHFLSLTPDSGQYQEQQIDISSLAQSQLAQSGVGDVGGKIDDSRYVSRIPEM